MSTVLIVIVTILGVLAAIVLLAIRSHLAWRAKQTPAGVWQAATPEGQITLHFEGGPAEGTYKQLADRGGVSVREFGHWKHASGQLELLIMGTDEKDHPEFGASIPHVIRFLTPTQIGIEGPRRPPVVYSRAPAGVSVQAEPAIQ